MLKKARAENSRWSYRVILKYVLMQLPGWLMITLIVLLVDLWIDLPTWALISAPLIPIAKDAVMYPFVWRAYDPNPENSAYRLVGERAITRGRLSPSGYVELHGELWKAELIADQTVEEGQAVMVLEVKGLTLLVQPEP